MTHGCLVVCHDDDKSRRILMHTYHTAMYIPKWVHLAPGLWALGSQAIWMKCQPPKTREELVGLWEIGYRGQFDYEPSVAAALSLNVNTLEVVPPDYEKDLPEWAGVDHTDRLTIYGDNEWKLETQWSDEEDWEKDKMHSVIIRPTDLAIEALAVHFGITQCTTTTT